MIQRPVFQRFIFSSILTMLVVMCFAQEAFAIREARPLPFDPRLRVITYHPNDIIKFTGHYEYQSSIVFEEDEVINSIVMGTPPAWQIVPAGHRLFLKPVQDNATTNMTVITSKRIYQFELHAREVDPDMGINDEELVFVMRFVYPDSVISDGAVTFYGKQQRGPDLSEPERYNFNYSISGSEEISPTRVFDDGEFTYFQFPRKNAEVPAFFRVAGDGTESLVNYRVQGDYIVLERVVSQLTLRSGDEITCIFNEMRPLKKKKRK